MSTIALATDFQSNLSIKDLRALAARFNIQIRPGADEEAYLLLLQSAEALHKAIEEAPDYIHPDLVPVPTTTPRTFRKLPVEENPLNAWSHACDLTASHATSTLLRGRTVVVKDNISVGGLPTTLGLPAWLHSRQDDDVYRTSNIDATVVSRLLNAGATLKGTAVCESYSAAPVSFTSFSGPVHNPWAKGFTAGGSSSGCGALMGQKAKSEQSSSLAPAECWSQGGRAVELAVGGDQGGSIRLPAAYNGVYGLKPTHGLVPYTGTLSISPMIDHLGPMATKLEDIALLLQVMAGYDGIDARMTPESPLRSQVKDYPRLLREFIEEVQSSESSTTATATTSSSVPRMRIGLLRESFDIPGLSTDVRDIVWNTAKEAFTAAGVEVIEISIPMHHQGPIIWTAATRNTMSDWAIASQPPGYLTYQPDHVSLQWPPDQRMFDQLTAINPTIMNLVFGTLYFKEKIGTGVEFKGHRKVFELRAAYDRALAEVDVLVTPTVPTTAFPFPQLKKEDGSPSDIMERAKVAVGLSYNTCAFNVTGHPAMNVPCGFADYQAPDEVKRLPVGMQLVAKRWDEETVLKAAALFRMGQSV